MAINFKSLAADLKGIENRCETLRLQMESSLEDATSALLAMEAALILQQTFQDVAKQLQQKMHAQVAGLVTKCLNSIFVDDHYEFKIEFESKRGKTEAAFLIEKNGVLLGDLQSSCGGGVVDVVAFALRLSSIMLRNPKPRRILIVDEPFKFLSAAYRPAAGELLRQLAEELDIQLIMVTHIPEFFIGNVIEL